jgi:hypothetical protein
MGAQKLTHDFLVIVSHVREMPVALARDCFLARRRRATTQQSPTPTEAEGRV